MNLDKQQIAAIDAPTNTPILVLAGPGSGKTLVLTHRAARLANEFPPDSVILCTFTKKAAEEMESRLKQLLPTEKVDQMRISTIHALCYRLLRLTGDKRRVIQEYPRRRMIEDIVDSFRWDVGFNEISAWLNRAKMDLIQPQDSYPYFSQFMEINDADILRTIYEDYQSKLKRENQLDFGDMILDAFYALKEGRWGTFQNSFSHILIDEFQDTSDAAIKVLFLLAKPQDQVFAVGDPDQLLYRFAGANPDTNVFGFREIYPSAQVFKLETNYRSGSRIIEDSWRMITRNYSEERAPFLKELKPRENAGEGEITVDLLPAADQEALLISQRINEYLKAGKSPGSFFVLYRTNAQSRSLEEAFHSAKIPYVLWRGVGFYQRAVIKDVLAYCRLARNRADDQAFSRICNIASASFNKHYRGFGKAFIADCRKGPNLWEGMRRLHLTGFKSGARIDFINLMSHLDPESPPSDLIRMIRTWCYDSYLKRKGGASRDDTGCYQQLEDLDELVFAAEGYEILEEFLDFVSEMQRAKEKSLEELDDYVILSTVHGVKGLERDVVFVAGCSQNLLPHYFSMNDVDSFARLPLPRNGSVKDERCVFYVAMTRAREAVHLSSILSHRGKEMSPSIFLSEMRRDEPS